MKISIELETDGQGYWSEVPRKVTIHKIEIGEEYSNEMCLYFTSKSWDIEKHGLIYTDPKFIKQFRAWLVKNGVPKKIANDIDYTEQGMQGDNYVSLEYGDKTRKYILQKAFGF